MSITLSKRFSNLFNTILCFDHSDNRIYKSKSQGSQELGLIYPFFLLLILRFFL